MESLSRNIKRVSDDVDKINITSNKIERKFGRISRVEMGCDLKSRNRIQRNMNCKILAFTFVYATILVAFCRRWNGRRDGLKIRWWQHRGGSSPSAA